MRTFDIDSIKAKYKIVGRDARLYRAIDTALQVARTDLSVLIQGESGVGKEVIPRIIHDNSPRKTSKYIAINCGSIPEGTIDSELFGHEKGSFTGAIGEHEGYFGAANGGTLFLDEVGELPMSTQARLLRVLETGEYIRVGSNEPRKTNVRIVAATNVNMQSAIREGKFREDLYFRLCTISIKMPPLRDRGEDVLTLFKMFALDTANKYQIPQPIRLSPEAEQVMLTYKWPGNIRQLRNLAEQMSILCYDQHIITPALLSDYGVLPGSDSTDMATIAGNAQDEQSGYSKERPIIFAMLNKLNKDIEQIKDQIVMGNPANNTIETSVSSFPANTPGFNTPTVLPYSPTIAPQDTTPTDIQPATISDHTDFHHVVEAEEEAELIEENSDLNIEKMERKFIEEALKRNKYRRKMAAAELGISERTLYRKIKDYGLEEM